MKQARNILVNWLTILILPFVIWPLMIYAMVKNKDLKNVITGREAMW